MAHSISSKPSGGGFVLLVRILGILSLFPVEYQSPELHLDNVSTVLGSLT